MIYFLEVNLFPKVLRIDDEKERNYDQNQMPKQLNPTIGSTIAFKILFPYGLVVESFNNRIMSVSLVRIRCYFGDISQHKDTD